MKWPSWNMPSRKQRWMILTVFSIAVLTITVTVFFKMNRDLGISFAQNIIAEVLGTVASILFIQRFVDIANQKEADQTKEMITNNFNNIRNLITQQNFESPSHSGKTISDNQNIKRRKRYSKIYYSQRISRNSKNRPNWIS